jgi:general secretion pathway protein I
MLHNEKGFTLLEIIVALTILAGGILTLVQMFSGSLNQAAQADRYLNGVYLAQQKFSQLEMDNFESETTEGSFESLENYHWQLEILPYESPLNNEEARIKIQKVSLRVYWEDGNQEKEVQLVSLKTLGETRTASASALESSSQATPAAPKVPEAPKIENLIPSAVP